MTTDSIPAVDEDHDTMPINTAGGGEGVMLDPVIGEPIDEKELAEQLLAQGVGLGGPGGLLSSLTKQVLDVELTEHLGHDHGEAPTGSSVRNGTRVHDGDHRDRTRRDRAVDR